MRISRKVVSAILTALMVQGMLTTGFVVTTSAYETSVDESTAQVQESNYGVYGDFRYTSSDNNRNYNDSLKNATIHYDCPNISLDKEELTLKKGQMYTLSVTTKVTTPLWQQSIRQVVLLPEVWEQPELRLSVLTA